MAPVCALFLKRSFGRNNDGIFATGRADNGARALAASMPMRSLRLVADNGLERTKAILNHESGLLGLSGGKSDMRNLMLDASADSAFAIEHFCYWSLRHAGSLIAAMEGLDAIAFNRRHWRERYWCARPHFARSGMGRGSP